MKIFFSIFLLFFSINNLFSKSDDLNKQSQIVYVDHVQRLSDLDKEEYYFRFVLDNHHAFDLKVSLDDLLNEKIYKGMAFQLISEEFIQNEPSFSLFTYESLDGSVHLQSKFDSLYSHWKPAESQEIITLTEKWIWRSENSSINYSVRFSDGSGWNIGHELYHSGRFNQGDEFFKILSADGKSSCLVNKADGRVIFSPSNSFRFTEVTW